MATCLDKRGIGGGHFVIRWRALHRNCRMLILAHALAQRYTPRLNTDSNICGLDDFILMILKVCHLAPFEY